MSQSLQFGVQSQGTLHAHRRDVSVGTTSTYSGFSPLERRSIHPSPPVKWLVEESSAKLPRQSNPITLLGHPNGLAPRFPVFSDVNNFDCSMSEAMTNGTTIHLGETSFKDTVVSPDLNNPMRYRWIRPPQEDLMKREDDNYLSSTLLDLSQVWILEPSSRAAETQAPTRVVKIDDRYICSICLKTHARPSRAIACENGHIGYQPFVCDGACGDPV
ncbi:hypothetical protein FRC19_001769, partial [Serendipita sp. 401]